MISTGARIAGAYADGSLAAMANAIDAELLVLSDKLEAAEAKVAALTAELEQVKRERDDSIERHKASTHEAVRRLQALGREKMQAEHDAEQANTRAITAETRVVTLEHCLLELREYFDGKADAEYFTDSPAPVPNEEALMLTLINEVFDK